MFSSPLCHAQTNRRASFRSSTSMCCQFSSGYQIKNGARTLAILAFAGSARRALVEKIRNETPRRSSARISFKTKVCDRRGQVLTTYPIFASCSEGGCISFFVHVQQLSEAIRRPGCPIHRRRAVRKRVVTSL